MSSSRPSSPFTDAAPTNVAPSDVAQTNAAPTDVAPVVPMQSTSKAETLKAFKEMRDALVQRHNSNVTSRRLIVAGILSLTGYLFYTGWSVWACMFFVFVMPLPFHGNMCGRKMIDAIKYHMIMYDQLSDDERRDFIRYVNDGFTDAMASF